MKDFRGEELAVGDRIAYATTVGNNVVMHEAIIEEIIEEDSVKKLSGYDVKKGKLKVLTNTGYRHWGKTDDVGYKRVTLSVPRRVAKLTDNGLPLAKPTY